MYDEQLEHRIDGAVYVDGAVCMMYVIQDQRATLEYKSDIRLIGQFKNGGQSSNRLQRIREENRQSFITNLVAKTIDLFYDFDNNNSRIANLVLYGPSRFKDDMIAYKKGRLGHHFNITIMTASENDLNPVIDKLNTLDNPDEIIARDEMQSLIDVANPKLVFGDDIKPALEQCSLAKLLISEHQDISKYEVDYGIEIIVLRSVAAIDWISQYGHAIGVLWFATESV